MTIITLSRQGGAGGITVSELVTKKLGYTLVDREVISEIAKHANVSYEWAQAVEKEAGGRIQRLIDSLISKNYIDRILGEDTGYLNQKTYIDTLKKVLNKCVEKDNCLVLGRGGQYIFRDNKNACHILIIADKKDRINFMIKRHNIAPSKAKAIVETHDRKRIGMFRDFGKKDFDSPELYHLVINTSKVKVEKAAEIICNLVK